MTQLTRLLAFVAFVVVVVVAAVASPGCVFNNDDTSAQRVASPREPAAATTTPDATRPLFAAVGYGGRRMVSDDGRVWRDDSADTHPGGDDDELLRNITAGNGVFVAGGGSATGRTIRTSDGVTWDQFDNPLDYAMLPVFGKNDSGDREFIALDDGQVFRSIDGLVWSDPSPLSSSSNVRFCTYGTRYVCVGDEGLRFSSADGRAWTSETKGGGDLQAAAFGDVDGNGTYVAAGYDRALWASTDGETWSDVGGDVAGALGDPTTAFNAVAFGDGVFVVLAEAGVATSRDGFAWTTVSDGLDDWPKYAIAFGYGMFVGIGGSDARYVSTDGGATWEAPVINDGNGITSIVAMP